MDRESLKSKFRWTWLSLKNILLNLCRDLLDYYWCPYPFLLIRGAALRLIRRLRRNWFPPPKSPGRPPISEEIVDLIIEIKRANWGWGSLRISNELSSFFSYPWKSRDAVMGKAISTGILTDFFDFIDSLTRWLLFRTWLGILQAANNLPLNPEMISRCR